MYGELPAIGALDPFGGKNINEKLLSIEPFFLQEWLFSGFLASRWRAH